MTRSSSAAALSTLVVLGLGALGCGVSRRLPADAECELTSQCDVPLVCRLGRCRTECATSSDCSVGLSCVLDDDGLGACQAASERRCLLASECPAPLVCREMQCVNECAEDRDCLGGARCVGAPAGVCIDTATFACSLDTDCVEAAETSGRAQFCFDGRCREACHTDRDCRNDLLCDPVRGCYDPTIPFDAGPPLRVDAGPIDASGSDAGESDAGESDAGDIDADVPASPCTGGPLEDVTSISMHDTFGCAISTTSGAPWVWCWGRGGEFAGDVTPPSTYGCARHLTQLDAFGAVEVTCGGSATCVRNTAGDVQCFGLNSRLELGRGAAGPGADPLPAPVMGVMGASDVVAGQLHWCAETATGLRCWGDNMSFQLGDMTALLHGVAITPTTTIVALEAEMGTYHTCGLDAGGIPVCMGSNSDLQLGLGGPMFAARMVTSGHRHACALDMAGDVYCWGTNSTNQLGAGAVTLARGTRERVDGLPGPATWVSASATHTCALVGDAAWCWGGPGHLGLGSGPAGPVLTPAPIFSGVTAIDTGFVCTCGIRTDGRVICMGQGSAGELGNGLSVNSPVPVEVWTE